jgi:hypothetical protein
MHKLREGVENREHMMGEAGMMHIENDPGKWRRDKKEEIGV